MTSNCLRIVLIASCGLLPGGIAAQEVADTIYTGGPILTIDDTRPTAEAVAVKDGRILAVGDLVEVSAHNGQGAKREERCAAGEEATDLRRSPLQIGRGDGRRASHDARRRRSVPAPRLDPRVDLGVEVPGSWRWGRKVRATEPSSSPRTLPDSASCRPREPRSGRATSARAQRRITRKSRAGTSSEPLS